MRGGAPYFQVFPKGRGVQKFIISEGSRRKINKQKKMKFLSYVQIVGRQGISDPYFFQNKELDKNFWRQVGQMMSILIILCQIPMEFVTIFWLCFGRDFLLLEVHPKKRGKQILNIGWRQYPTDFPLSLFFVVERNMCLRHQKSSKNLFLFQNFCRGTLLTQDQSQMGGLNFIALEKPSGNCKLTCIIQNLFHAEQIIFLVAKQLQKLPMSDVNI